MRGDEVVARKRGPPLAFAARDKDDLALLIGEPIERLLDGEIGAPLSLASARIRKHVGPPFLGRWRLWVRPRSTFDCIAGLYPGRQQLCDIGESRIEQDEIRRHGPL